MELADAIVINKADGKNLENAEKARMAYQRALHLFPPKESGWTPPVMTASALNGLHIPEIWNIIEDYQKLTLENKYREAHRKEQMRQWLRESFEDLIYQCLREDKALNEQMRKLEYEVINARISAAGAASLLFRSWIENLHGKG
jgi:LAO/AO transport system kinase